MKSAACYLVTYTLISLPCSMTGVFYGICSEKNSNGRGWLKYSFLLQLQSHLK
jgi:hypothetical protein